MGGTVSNEAPLLEISQCSIGEARGFYKLTRERYNGSPVWQKTSDSDKWLLKVSNGRWMVTRTEDKVSGKAFGWLESAGFFSLYARPTEVTEWRVFDGKSWKVQAVKVSDKTAIPQWLQVSGATAANCNNAKKVNGSYLFAGDLYNDSPIWQNASNSDMWLLKFSNGNWMVTSTEAKVSGKAFGWLESVNSNRARPTEVPEWKAWDGKSWEVQAVKVSDKGAIPQKLQVSGATAANCNNAKKVNGLYLFAGDLYNDSPIWQNASNSDMWLLQSSNGRWYVTSTEWKVSGKPDGWLESLAAHHARPTGVTDWKSWDGTKWTVSTINVLEIPSRVQPECYEDITILPQTKWQDLKPKMGMLEYLLNHAELQSRLPDWATIANDVELKSKELRLAPATGKLVAALDDNELQAIVTYTHDLNTSDKSGNFYFEENKDLRKRDAEDRVAMLQLWGTHVFYALKGLGKLPDFAGEVFRGSPDSHMKNEYTTGRPIQWGAWTSTSTDLFAAKSFASTGVIFKISVLTGKDIQAMSFFQTEGEILLTPNHKFVVTKAAYEKDGYTFIDLHEIQGKLYVS